MIFRREQQFERHIERQCFVNSDLHKNLLYR